MLSQKELAKLHNEAEIELGKYPGVVGVGYGYKETEGKFTNQLSFCVYVEEKKAESDLLPEELIPVAFKGVTTDVLTVPEGINLHCQDLDIHSPLIGGIGISSLKNFLAGISSSQAGTLGFFAYLNGVGGPDNVVAISNRHVIMNEGAAEGDIFYQPKRQEFGGTFPIDRDHVNPIGVIHDQGLDGNHSFQYGNEGTNEYGIDCASIKLNISVSSWCNTNTGISYRNLIRELNITDSDNNVSSRINDVERVSQSSLTPGDYAVFKVGTATGRTVGRVVKTNAKLKMGTITFENIIEIEATEPNCDGELRFANFGDSGAAIVNSKRNIVGILKARSTEDDKRAYACHIHPVLDRLEVTAISEANPPVGPAGEVMDDSPGSVTGGIVNHTPLLYEKFQRSEEGRTIYQLFLKHRLEVTALVNNSRPVIVAWHRSKGPAYFSHILNNARDPDHLIPFEIEGINRETLLLKMAQVLSLHGSSQLKADLEQHFDEVLFYMNRFDSIHELVEQFESVNQHG